MTEFIGGIGPRRDAGATVASPPADAPPLPGRTVFDQRWTDLAFLHWPVDPASVVRFMPPGVRPDVWTDGMTYVGLVPFRMRRAGFGRGVPVPWFGWFLEWNVRLYSVDDAGRHGVVFRSLDATRLAVVLAARAGGVPYRWARISTDRDGDEIHWSTRRVGRSDAHCDLRLQVGAPTGPTSLETFLISRWGMHSRWRNRTVWVPNEHGRWPLRRATVTHLDDTLVRAAGIEPAGAMLRPLWTPGVHARFARPQVVESVGPRP